MTRWLIAVLSLSLAAGCAGPSQAAATRAAPLKVADTVAFSEGHFQSHDGLKLYEASWRPTQGEPRAVLVIMHGLKDHADRYSELAEKLVGEGFAVHAFDLRGHALSEGERAWVEKFDHFVQDLDAFMARVRQKEPGKKIFLYGHSAGGAISALYSLEKKPDLAGLILAAPALKPGKDVSGFLIAASGFMSAVAPRAKLVENPPEKFSRDPAVVEAMKRDPLIHNENGPARLGAEILNAMERISKKAPELSMPLLVLHGDADQLTNIEGSQEFVNKVSSTDKRLITYPGLSHDLVHEPEKQQVIEDIRAWLTGQVGG